jgi:DNA-binding CsgD family transcriptional regulator
MRSDLPLTPRQIEACALRAQGFRRWEIAERMGIALETVDVHFDAAKRRMEARTIGQLMFMLGAEVRGGQHCKDARCKRPMTR